ncbi:hypothetical protein L226DRAFT_528924 [Lentinus tigrinus ALCF2SS1-7]|uniref:uncharacterized protein n=1 Tax=Lentinus tigrinus ALCF2SS1-7 TaxID=1328758 RepID=UPI0011662A52|nr:hypothetical protein L226DRAFT_528924 [Lentinus tigrinus ALCF2SS1-7]
MNETKGLMSGLFDGLLALAQLLLGSSTGPLHYSRTPMPSNRSPRASPRLATSASSAYNVTVDDKYGDQKTGFVPLYLPQGAWAQGSECSGCALNSTYINPSKVLNGSWHDSTYHPGKPFVEISIDFVGIAVYVYHVIVNHPPAPGVTVLTNLTFVVDNVTMGTYTHHPHPDKPPILYDIPVYVNTNLTNEKHTLQIQSGGPSDALVLFDYVQYTVDPPLTRTPEPISDPPYTGSITLSFPTTTSTSTHPISSSSPRLSPGAIAAIAVSVGLAATLVIITAVLYRCRARAKSHKATEDETQLIAAGTQERHDTFASCAGALQVPQASPPAVPWSCPSPRPTLPPPPPLPSHAPRRPPPRHGADVPAPALSVTGTERSVRYEELMQELATLEDMVRGIQEAAKARRLGTAGRTTDGQTDAVPSERYTATQKVKLISIRSQMKRVRRMIQDERRLMEEALPRFQR